MVIQNQHIKRLDRDDLEGHDTFCVINCVINEIDLIAASKLQTELIIKQCIIEKFNIHSCWFVCGLSLKNNIINNYIDYQMGGHNISPIIIEGNIFTGFFNFFDCQFENVIEVKHNVFEKGANLLGNREEGFANFFANGYVVEHNIGRIDIDEIY